MKTMPGIVTAALIGLLVGGLTVSPYLWGDANQPITFENDKDLVSFRDVVKRVMPSIVSIEADQQVTTTKMGDSGRNPLPPGFENQIPEEFRRFFKDFRGTPMPDGDAPDSYQRRGFGSGFVVAADGVIMTNYHVVNGADKVTVQFMDGSRYVSTDIRGDRKTDLAIVRIDTKGKKLPFLQFGDSEKMEIGDRVLAFGAPFGLRGSVTHGIVSAKGRNGLQMNMYEDFIQTDAAINPGNSGGPLISLDGRVIGINSAIKSRSGGFNGVGLAIASNLASNVKNALLEDGVVRRGYLGVQVRELTPDVAKAFGLQQGVGVVVGKVYANTPAARGGLKEGDIITEIGGKTITDARILQLQVASSPLNKATKMAIVRDGAKQTLNVTIEEQPEQFGLAENVPGNNTAPESTGTSLEKIGVSVQNVTAQLASKYGYGPDVRGVLIVAVDRNSVAFGAGLREGMIIQKIDNQPVLSVEDATRSMANADMAKGVLLQYRSAQTGVNYVLLQMATK